MEIFDKAIYWISSGLLIPVMVAVAFFIIRGLLLIGKFYGLYIDRLKFNKQIKPVIDDLTTHSDSSINFNETEELPAWKANLFAYGEQNSGSKFTMLAKSIDELLKHPNNSVVREKIIAEFEVKCELDLDKSRTLSKIGPMLGLMGTLIPMGPALAGLAAGDIATMSHQMQIAFNTTVMGLVIGGIGFLTLQTKQRWYAQDLNKIEFINAILEPQYKRGEIANKGGSK
jgi:biopolymer transport protein ExbB/TolQ